MAEVKKCTGCDKLTENYVNWCSWECNVAHAKANGGIVHTPNGLPITTITCDGVMMEHEHADHPDYKFPVDVEYVGVIDEDDILDAKMLLGDDVEPTEERVRMIRHETHALIYSDGNIALTLYEYCYFTWLLHNGEFEGGPKWAWHHPKKGGVVQYRMTNSSRDKIKERWP